MSNTIPSDGPDELDETETEMAFELAHLRFTSTCYNVCRKEGELKLLLTKEVATKPTSLSGVEKSLAVTDMISLRTRPWKNTSFTG